MNLPLFFQRRFLPLWLGQSFGALSDNMNRQVLIIGVPFGAISLSGYEESDAIIPLIGALFPIAMLFGSMYGGQFAEKYETRLMFRRTKIAEIILMMIAAFGLLTQQGWFLVFALFGMGLQSSFFNPTRQSAMPKYLAANELIRGNGLVNAGLYGCILLGYGLGGHFISLEKYSAEYTAAFLVAFSTLGYLSVWFAPKAAPTNPDLKIEWTAYISAMKMTKMTFQETAVVRPIIGIAIFYFVSTAVTVVLPIFVRDSLGADGTATTMIILLFAIGAGMGAIISASLAKGRSGLRFSTMAIGASSITSLAIYFIAQTYHPDPQAELLSSAELFSSTTSKFLGALLCLTATLMGIYLAPLQAAIQRRAPNDRRARILSVGNMLVAIAALLGSLSVLAVTQTPIKPDQFFIMIAIILSSVALYMVWRSRKVPVGLYDESLTKLKT